MTFQQKLMQNIDQIDLLLIYLPYCNKEDDRNEILKEVSKLRRRVSDIEEMTKTERQKEIKIKTMTIESELNNLK